jgi:hypothetical protein
MSEYYYRYNTDDATIDLENDEIYDYCLEREKLKELDNIGPKCMRDFGGEFKEEHFGNLKGSRSLASNLLVLLVVIIVLYLAYSLMCENNSASVYPAGKYVAKWN